MGARSVGGRPSLFRGKGARPYRVQGNLTPRGGVRFEEARVRLGDMCDVAADRISDADVIEYLARGERESLEYFVNERKEATTV